MTKYIIQRAAGIIPAVLAIVTISFFIIRIAPGGPFDVERKLPEQVLRNIEAKYHLDEPLVQQYFRYIGNLLRGDLGPSYRYHDHDVNFFIFSSLPHSILLGGVALILALLAGIVVGIISALRQNRWIDYSSMFVAVFGISVPAFVIGPVLVYWFSIQLKIFPTSGWINVGGGIRSLILPVITLSLFYFATIARLSRAGIIEVLRSDYVRTARAKGLPTGLIVVKHVLKGALLPVVSYLGPAMAAIVTGSVVVETIFLIPGLGRFFVQSAFNRDYTLLLGSVIVYSVLLIILNFIVDILYGLLDPRISYS